MIERIREKIDSHISTILAKSEISAEDFGVLMQYLGKLEFERDHVENKKKYMETMASLIGGVI